MSFNRHAAISYGNKVAPRSTRTQPSNFSKTTSGPPTYAFQNSQRGNVDDSSAETETVRNEEKKIEDDQENQIIDKNDFSQGAPSSKTRTPTSTTSAKPAAQTETKSAFAKCWTTVSDINIPKRFNDDKSFFVPASITLMEVLSNIENVLDGNEELRWICPNYFSLPVRVYYSVMYYVQILRAKEQAGKLRKNEGSWLRAFGRRFKDTSCPIVGPLVPIFSNIVACLPDDDQYDFIYPTFNINGTYRTINNEETRTKSLAVDSHHFLSPSIPLIGGLFHTFCNTPTLTNDFFNKDGHYVPFNLEIGGTIGGFTLSPLTRPNSVSPEVAKLLHNPALMHPLPENKDRMKEIHTYWTRSRAKDFPVVAPNLTFDPSTPAEITCLGEDLDWFQPCIDMATIQTKFYTDSTNLSAIPTIGGQSSLVQSLLSFPRQKETPNSLREWYPDVFSSAKAVFRSTTSELPFDHTLQAAYCLTNSKLEWKDQNGNRIGSLDSGIRDGSYWKNKKYNHVLETPTHVMTGLSTLLQSQFYEARGKA